MISFTIITSTPAVLATRLINQGILKQVTARDNGDTQYIGVFEGLEWVEVPNPIITTLGRGTPDTVGYVPPVMDTRHCYLVKVVRTAENDQTAGLQQTDTNPDGTVTWRDLLHRTKLGQWVLNNSTVVTLTSADGRSWPARQVGTNFWAVDSSDFGVWQ